MNLFKNLYVYDLFYLHVCLCIKWLSCAHGGQNRALDPLELELLIIISRHVGAGY